MPCQVLNEPLPGTPSRRPLCTASLTLAACTMPILQHPTDSAPELQAYSQRLGAPAQVCPGAVEPDVCTAVFSSGCRQAESGIHARGATLAHAQNPKRLPPASSVRRDISGQSQMELPLLLSGPGQQHDRRQLGACCLLACTAHVVLVGQPQAGQRLARQTRPGCGRGAGQSLCAPGAWQVAGSPQHLPSS